MPSRQVGSLPQVLPHNATSSVRMRQRNRSRPMAGLVPWFGGKGLQAAQLVQLVPPSVKYVEAYGGGASLLMRLEPRKVEVYNDLDRRLINLCRVLQNRRLSAALRQRLSLTLYSREEFRLAVRTLHAESAGPVDRAWAFYVTQVQGFSGIMRCTEGSWACSRQASSCDMAPKVSTWWGRVAGLADQIERFARVQVESRCALDVIEVHDSKDTVHYLDPPYVHSTRAKGATKEYAHEQPDDHHRQLVELLQTVKGKVILSGYANELYRPLERRGWIRIDRETACHSVRVKVAAIRPKRVESVWLNFTPETIPNSFCRAGESLALAA